VTADLEGLLNAYRLATAPQDDDRWSPIEQERRDHEAAQWAKRIADLLLRERELTPV